MNEKNEALNKLLLTRISQYKMLNNTLTQIIENNGSEMLIDSIKKEVNDTLNEIQKIKLELNNQIIEKEEETTYSYYDSIKKQPKLDYGCDKIEENTNKCANESGCSKMRSNRFIVHLNESLNVPSNMVKAVSFDPSVKQLSICIYDFINEIGNRKYALLGMLKYVQDSFNFSIEHFDAFGNVLYTEKYLGCHIEGVYRDPIDYFCLDFSTVQVFVTYKDVTYEANN